MRPAASSPEGSVASLRRPAAVCVAHLNVLCVVYCPECESSLETTDDIEFAEMDTSPGLLKAAKRFYTANCAACVSLGSGVAGT